MKSYSELQQERAGTLNRNKVIVFRYELGITQVKLAEQYNLTRQRIHQIVHRKPQNPNLSGLRSRVMVFIKRLFHKKKSRHIRIVSPLRRIK